MTASGHLTSIMTLISAATTIARPIEQICAYVTVPAHWFQWRPSALGVAGATDHSLVVGEQVTEECSVAGRRGDTTWTARVREALSVVHRQRSRWRCRHLDPLPM